MTLREIKNRVDHIKKIVGDNEAAHSEEDSLYSDFIAYLAKTASPKYREMAKTILKTQEIDFRRWCA